MDSFRRLGVATALLVLCAIRLSAQTCRFDIKQASLPDGVVGTSYSASLSLTDTSTPTYTWSASTLPPGLKLTVDAKDSSLATLAGTPSKEGPYRFDITVIDKDGGGCKVIRTYAI